MKFQLKSFIKYLLISFGVLIAVVIIFFALLISITSEDEKTKNTSYHPFKSEKLKATYLILYEKNSRKWPANSISKFVDTSYGKTFVRVTGPNNGLPLVLLHGSGGSSLDWLPYIEALSGAYRTYAIDGIYGNGKSVYTKTVRNSDDYVQWLNELFRALGINGNINLMGLSYGGWIAGQYLVHHPKGLKKVVLIAPAATVLPISPQWLGRMMVGLFPFRACKKYFFRGVCGVQDLSKVGEAEQEKFLDGVMFASEAFKPIPTAMPTIIQDKELRAITVPTLIIIGEYENMYSAQKAVQRIGQVAPYVNTTIIPGTGHLLTLMKKDVVKAVVLDFLKKP
jgi:pimeloyl-ACP methyl ester carboxylesterase